MQNNNTGWIIAIVVLAIIIIGGIAWAGMQPQADDADAMGTVPTGTTIPEEQQPYSSGVNASTSLSATTTLP